jgi:hypothetical protein
MQIPIGEADVLRTRGRNSDGKIRKCWRCSLIDQNFVVRDYEKSKVMAVRESA